MKRVEALWEAQALRYQEKVSLFKSSLSDSNRKIKPAKLPSTTTGNELLKDYNALNFSLRTHPMALLRHMLNTRY